MPRATLIICATGVAVLLLVAYGNHFQNGFHFDDSHAIEDNVFLRDLANVPRFFTDATTFSVLPQNQSYRPVLQATLAIDYWLAGGYTPWVFQADTFLWFVLQLLCLWGLYREVIRRAVPAGDPALAALVAAGAYGLHPVGAETVNYVIQRGEILSTLGVVAALWIYAAGLGWWLWILPLVFGILSKPPALVFPVLLACYVTMVERPSTPAARRTAWTSVAIATTVSVVSAWWLASHTPPAYITGASSTSLYLLSQPWVTLRYLLAFVAPIDLSADNDWGLVSGWSDPRVWFGLIAVGALVWSAVRAGRTRQTTPIAFGLSWFVIALLPTALTPLAEVANDHRMYFPFVGLALAAAWIGWLGWQRLPAGSKARRAAVVALIVILLAGTAGVAARNRVWHSDESLWYDVTIKSPTNGRGLMNYGLSRMEQGDFATAVQYYERALVYTPNYQLVYINLGIAYGGLKRTADAERAFVRAQELAPNDWRSHYYYARWLSETGRLTEAVQTASRAVALNAADAASKALLARLTSAPASADQYVALSLAQYREGRFRESIASAQAALALQPNYAEAYNNVAAAHIALGEYDAGIAAANEALRLKPDLQIARNNLAYAMAQKAKPRD